MNIIPFQFETKNVRVILVNKEPWFVAKDVAEVLEYERPSKAILDHCEEAKLLIDLTCPETGHVIGISDLHPSLKFIPESDVYGLAFASRAKGAKRFREWLKKEVLPSIRKTGGYQVQAVSTLDMFELAGKAMRELEARQKETDAKLNALSGKVSEIQDILEIINGEKYCRVSGYISRKLKINLDLEAAKREGKAIKKLALSRGIEVKKIQDTNYGGVNVYPVYFLDEVYKSGSTLTINTPESTCISDKVRSIRAVK